ncbi:MAG: DUF4159 domain-containing protein [Planctomycetota bacterium]
MAFTLCSTAGLASGDPTERVDALVERLKLEAPQLPVEKANERANAPSFSKPHRTLPRTELSPALAEAAARELLKVRGDSLESRYLRYHLMGVIEAGLERPGASAQAAPSPVIAEAAVKTLAADRPAEYLRGDFEPVEVREPIELFHEYQRLDGETTVSVGVPPFTRTLRGEAAIRVVGPAQAQRIRAAMARREALDDRLTPLKTDREAAARNQRRSELNWLTRDPRASAAELIISYGDDADVEKTIDSAMNAADRHQQSGFDVLDAITRQIIDGRADLTRLDSATIDAISQRLGRASRGSGKWSYPSEGKTRLTNQRSVQRNPAELARQMEVYFRFPAISASLANAAKTIEQAPSARPPSYRSANASGPLTLESIEGSINAARPWINDAYGRYGVSQPMRIDLPPYRYNDWLNWGRRAALNRKRGTQSALAWAMVGTGQPSQSPGLLNRVQTGLAGDSPTTFNRAMRTLMAAQLPGAVYEPDLRRQVAGLIEGMSDKGGWGASTNGDAGWGDHAHAQYAVYALAAAERAGVSIPNKVWEAIDRHWRATQQKTPGDQPAGWRIAGMPFGQEPDGARVDEVSLVPTAGGVAALSIVDRVLADGSEERRKAIDKGVAWLDRHFTTAESPNDRIDWYFTMWSLQQVGKASGRSVFNDVDWFRDITPLIIQRQRNGLWYSEAFGNDPTMPTAMALLYLASALDPVAVARVEHGSGWDDEIGGLGRFTRYASDRYERDTHWTTTDLSRPLTELLDYPMLFIGATDALNFSDAQVDKLRDYVQAGGLLLLNPSDPKAAVGRSFRTLLEKIAPGREIATIEPEDTIYDIHREVRPSVRMQAIGSDVRPWAIWFIKDLNEDLAKSRGESDALVTMSNLYLYRVGRNPRRTRLDSPHLAAAPSPSRTVSAARLSHSGDFDPEPAALDQLSRYLAANHRTGLDVTTVAPGSLSDSVDIAFLTTVGDGVLDADEAEAIRRWCEAGGTLVMDAAGGSAEAVAAAEAMFATIFPDRTPVPISPASPLLTGQGLPDKASDRSSVEYRLYTLQQGVLTDRPRLSTVTLDGRDAVIFSAEDLTCGWAGLEHWGINGYTIDDARGLGANAVLGASR